MDKMPVKFLRAHILQNWLDIQTSIKNGTYEPMPVRRVEIPKPNGGIRLLGIPTVTDRFIQQAIAQILTPIYDPTFSENSYGFRPRRRAHDAVRKARAYMEEGYQMGNRYGLREVLRQSESRYAYGTLSKKSQR